MRTIACALALLAAPLPAAAQDGNVGGRYRLWQAEFEGNVTADDNGVNGSDIDVRSTLNLGDAEPVSNFSVWAGFAGFRLFIDYYSAKYDGDSTLTQTITFAGTSFSAGSALDSDVEWRNITTMFEYRFGIPMSSAVLDFNLGVRLGLKYMRVHVELTSPTTSDSATIKAPAPVVGFVAELGITQYLSVGLEVDGLIVRSFGGGSASGQVIDWAFVVRGHLGPGFAGIGWRDFLLHIDVNDVSGVDGGEVDVTIRGFFFEIGATF